MRIDTLKANIVVITLFFFVFSGFAYANAKLFAIQVENTDTTSRLEFKLSDMRRPHIFTLQNPDRLVIDFDNTELRTALPVITSPLLKTMRSGHPIPLTLRLVIDLKEPVHTRTSWNPNRFLLDVYPNNTSKTTVDPVKKIQSTPTIIATHRAREMVVVIDPGHGGKDPGAVGDYGGKEKNVVLAISLRLARLINQQPNMRAVLTRQGDYFVPLADRLKLARKGKADLFIAIHADSYFNNRANGASVYALSHRGATSVAARWLANRENHSELGGVDLRGLEDQSLQLRSVLIDLAQTATITDSLRLGTSMLDALDSVTNLHYSRVEQAPFMVLKSPDIPSILVEIGFISNVMEEKKLRDAAYQNKMAQALLNGIRLYTKKYSVMHI